MNLKLKNIVLVFILLARCNAPQNNSESQKSEDQFPEFLSSFDYQPEQQVLKAVVDPLKMDPSFEGPYSIVRVHTNGTITIQRAPGIEERLNIRRVRPYRS